MKKISSYIDFADSHFKSFQTLNQDLTIHIVSWEEKDITVVFFNVIQFVFRQGSVIEDIYEGVNDSAFLLEVLQRHYNKIPVKHTFKNFIILDINDTPIFEVISEKVIITKK